MLIKKGDKILLARGHNFKPGVYSAIAGYVDIGETCEQAAIREVKEEVNIDIGSLTYFSSQSWPFAPSSFLIAFVAQYIKGDIKVDGNEIEDAQWFDTNNLPKLPDKKQYLNKTYFS